MILLISELPMAAMSVVGLYKSGQQQLEEQQREELNAFLGPSKYRDELRRTAKLLIAPSKGLLACDEPPHVLPGRMKMCWTDPKECTEAWRIKYRELMFTTEGLGAYVSGIILHEETCSQTMARKGCPDKVPQLLESMGIIPGVKLDQGFSDMPGSTCGDWRTAGLDGLRERCATYRALGLRFAKWRAPLKIDGSEAAVNAEADALACYARVCQDEGLVPIVEPDVVIEGDHGVAAAACATKRALVRTFAAMDARGVDVRGSLLKTNMVRCGPGHACAERCDLVASATVQVFADALPSALPGVVFLSGGMSEAFATSALAAINRDPNRKSCPYPLTFSYGRALQHCFRVAWEGKSANEAAAQAALLACARRNSEASLGKTPEGQAASTDSLHVAGGSRY